MAVQVDSYRCKHCKYTWRQPTDQVPQCPACKSDPRFYTESYGRPAFERAEAGEFLRNYTSEERKEMPVHKGVMLYFPDALAAVARVSFKGNQKHNPGETLHWSRGKSNDHSDCAARHQLTPDAIDAESGEQERAHATWRALADLQIAEEKRLVSLGIRPLSGVVK